MGGKSKKTTVGYWYRPAFHAGLGIGPLDAFLEFRGGDKTAWAGELTASSTLSINAPNLWGGEKDQGGIVGDVDVMFGEADQQPNAYLASVFGSQQPAWRGLATLVFKGGKYGAMNPYPQKASYKIRKITKGWDNDVCWYPSKAGVASTEQVIVSNTATGWEYVQLAHGTPYDPGHDGLFAPASGWTSGQSPFGSGSWTPSGLPARNTQWDQDSVLWIRRNLSVPSASNAVVRVFAENGCCIFINGAFWRAINQDNVQIQQGDVIEFQLPPGDYELSIKAFDEYPTQGDTYLSASVVLRYGQAMNPAHILYYAITQSDMGREPVTNINSASFTAAADWFYAHGFGLCTSYDPSAESVEEFQQRICRVAGSSMTRSLIDGQWYLDIANGEYTLGSLPILTDDDVLEFEEQPTVLDNAVNSVSVKYFDPEKKEAIVTQPVQAPALIADFGTNHVTLDYQEIPNADLAARVAQRELQARITPLRGFSLKTTRKPYAWRPSTYFRLQLPKRGIADMVCIFGEKSSGSLRSGAMSVKATQDVYSVPGASFVEVEDGSNTTPSQQPSLITRQRVFEAPYATLSATLSHADLAALPADAGFLMAVADDPATTRDYTLLVQPAGGEYEATADGEWTPTALIVEVADRLDNSFTLVSGKRLAEVTVGMAALWDDEIVRVDAINAGAGTIELGRGCADTIPQAHAANSRIWFYDAAAAGDATEYSDAETVIAKLLDNTATQQFPQGSAIPLPMVFDQRAFRPYPPAAWQINGDDWPDEVTGDIVLTWNHRDRVAQANVLLDNTEASTGPEPGTTYTAEFFTEAGSTALHSETGMTATTYTWSPPANGNYRIELMSVRDGVNSWQKYVHVVQRGPALWTPASLSIAPKIWVNDTSAVTEVSGVLSQVNDLSGNGLHLTQDVSSQRPARVSGILNGLPVFRFDGANDWMFNNTSGAYALLNGVAEAWLVAVHKASVSSSGNRYICGLARSDNNSARFLAVGSSTTGGTYTNRPGVGGRSQITDSYSEVRSATVVGTNWAMSLHRIKYPTKTGILNVNGNAAESATLTNMTAVNSQATNNSAFAFGADTSYLFISSVNSSFSGDIAEMVFGTGTLTTTDIEKLFGYLAHKWGLTANLPVGHPYKNDPPTA